MKATVVPNRNMILLSIAIGAAIAKKLDYVAYAAHAGDHAIYPDCRPEFARDMGRVASKCDWRPIKLLRPFVKMSKAWIIGHGKELGVDYSKTWSCYEGGALHCGRCGTCVERILSFKEAKVDDPTTYQDPEFAKQYEK
jgi:7-cyano-7-deazaguanine synthase